MKERIEAVYRECRLLRNMAEEKKYPVGESNKPPNRRGFQRAKTQAAQNAAEFTPIGQLLSH